MVVMNQSSAASPAIKSISLTTNIGFRSPPIIPSADGEQDTILDYDTDNGGKHLPQGAISRSQRRLMIAILAGFTGYYFCRTNLVVSMSSLLKSLPGVDKGELGTVLSFGYLFYAIGKLVNGALIDIYGGRKMFLVGLMGTVGCTLLITLAPSFISVGNGTITTTTAERTLFALGCVWSMNRFFQSAGWGSLVKVLSHAFPSSMHGRVLGMATLSYGAGDVIIRLILGMVLAYMEQPDSGKFSEADPTVAARAWKAVFLAAFFIASGLAVPGLLWLRERSDFKRHNNSTTATNLHHHIADGYDALEPSGKPGFISVIIQLARKPKFWILFSMSPCLTLIRETLATWTQVMLADLLKISDSSAAMMSLIFPLFGTVSTLLGGYAIDKATPFRRGFIPVFCLFFLTFSLALTAHFAEQRPGSHSAFGLGFLVMLLSLSLMAPFSFVDGLFILSLVNRSSQGIAIGIINCVGYVGAIMAGHAMGSLAETEGWDAVFSTLTTISIISCILSSLYWWFDVMEVKATAQPGSDRRGNGSQTLL